MTAAPHAVGAEPRLLKSATLGVVSSVVFFGNDEEGTSLASERQETFARRMVLVS